MRLAERDLTVIDPNQWRPERDEQKAAGPAAINIFRHLGPDLSGQVGADPRDQRRRDDVACLHHIRRRGACYGFGTSSKRLALVPRPSIGVSRMAVFPPRAAWVQIRFAGCSPKLMLRAIRAYLTVRRRRSFERASSNLQLKNRRNCYRLRLGDVSSQSYAPGFGVSRWRW
jgi:hypothetical protein